MILFTDTQQMDIIEEEHTYLVFHVLVATVHDDIAAQLLEGVILFRHTDDTFTRGWNSVIAGDNRIIVIGELQIHLGIA